MKKFCSICLLVFLVGFLSAQDLGGGYRNTKWGMTYKEVKKILSKEGYKLWDEYEKKDYGVSILTQEYYDKDGRVADFMFQDNKLYAVIYKPFHFTKGATQEKGKKIVQELINKYGEDYWTEKRPGTLSDINSFYWEDEITQIRCDIDEYMKPVVNYDDRIIVVYLNKPMTQAYEDKKNKTIQEEYEEEENGILGGL